jgi:hypothetical protein
MAEQEMEEVITVKDLGPAIKEIEARVRKMSEPDSKFFKEHGESVTEWANAIGAAVDGCCATHVLEAFAELQMRLTIGSTMCKADGCTDYLSHEFLENMAKIINDVMGDHIRELTVSLLLGERKN